MAVNFDDAYIEAGITRFMKRKGIRTKPQAARYLIHERLVMLGYLDRSKPESNAKPAVHHARASAKGKPN